MFFSNYIEAPPVSKDALAGLSAYGYATGYYVGACSQCQQSYMGAKQSIVCWECAFKAALWDTTGGCCRSDISLDDLSDMVEHMGRRYG